MGINHLWWRIPEDSCLQGGDCSLLIATTLVYAAAEKKGLGVGLLNNQHLSNFRQRLVISSLLGASIIAQQLTGRPGTSGILFVVLVIGGIAVQAEMMRRRAPVV